ncbi:MAG: VOC family protein [Granulosicoccus sp.]
MNEDSAPRCEFDHLVLGASTCREGADWFQQLSGIELPVGGKHPLMATHNHLSALSDNSFLEIIAIDPDASAVPRARWFALDDPMHRERLQKRPRLTTWVARTSNLDAALESAARAGIDAGIAVTQQRDDLTWRLSLRPDGSLACEGLFPILIEWPAGVNPVARMNDQGIRLDVLRLTYPDVHFLEQALQAVGANELVSVSQGDASLTAQLSAGELHFQLTN